MMSPLCGRRRKVGAKGVYTTQTGGERHDGRTEQTMTILDEASSLIRMP